MNRVFPPVRGATGRLARDLARGFAREGWHVTVISSGPVAGEQREAGIRVIRVKGPEKTNNALIYLWVWFKMMVLALRLKSRHLLVTMSDPPLVVVAGAFVAKIKKSRHINWCQDLYPDVLPALGVSMPDGVLRFLKKRRVKAMQSCDAVIVVGRWMARHVLNDGVIEEKTHMIPNWPDLELTDPEMVEETGTPYEKVSPDLVRPFEEQIKTGQKFRILYAGNIGRAHPVDCILEAAQRLEKKKTDIEFVFVGDGPRYDYLAEQRAERGLDNVRLLPYQPVSKLREIMESGDVHLVSMNDEAAGLVVPSKLYSALAVARPTIFIGPENTETAKVIAEYEAGLVVAQDDTTNLVRAIQFFRNNAEAWMEAHYGAIRAREIYTPQNAIKAWMECAWDIVENDLKE